jgi:hypothetical protein
MQQLADMMWPVADHGSPRDYPRRHFGRNTLLNKSKSYAWHDTSVVIVIQKSYKMLALGSGTEAHPSHRSQNTVITIAAVPLRRYAINPSALTDRVHDGVVFFPVSFPEERQKHA